jgi:hypothetical protein
MHRHLIGFGNDALKQLSLRKGQSGLLGIEFVAYVVDGMDERSPGINCFYLSQSLDMAVDGAVAHNPLVRIDLTMSL